MEGVAYVLVIVKSVVVAMTATVGVWSGIASLTSKVSLTHTEADVPRSRNTNVHVKIPESLGSARSLNVDT